MSDGEYDELLRVLQGVESESEFDIITEDSKSEEYDSEIYKASMVSMMAGADFIKTSTGKEAVNATLPIGLIMCRAIRKHYQTTGVRVGLKPAGGIKTARDAVNWLVLVYTELGPEWLTPKLCTFSEK